MIEGFEELEYISRLQLCGLTTLETRRLRGDLIEVFKIMKGFEDLNANDFFIVNSRHSRGHSLKVYKPNVNTDIGKFRFSYRVINEWNLLDNDIVACSSVNLFKDKIDKYLKRRGFI